MYIQQNGPINNTFGCGCGDNGNNNNLWSAYAEGYRSGCLASADAATQLAQAGPVVAPTPLPAPAEPMNVYRYNVTVQPTNSVPNRPCGCRRGGGF